MLTYSEVLLVLGVLSIWASVHYMHKAGIKH